MKKHLIVVRENVDAPPAAPATEVVAFEIFRRWLRSGGVFARARRYASATLLCHANSFVTRPTVAAVALKVLSADASFQEPAGARRDLSWSALAKMLNDLVSDFFARTKVLDRLMKDVAALNAIEPVRSLRDGRALYVRTDLAFGLGAGGSVAHTAGMLNNLNVGGPPLFVAPDVLPLVDPSIETTLVPPEPRFWDFIDFPTLAYNERALDGARRVAAGRAISFVYHRYSRNSLAALKMSRELRVPFVLEYNGSELWVSRHWGGSLPYAGMTRDIEEANLRGATLIVVVSQPSADELISRGFDASRILVNPNGVDPGVYAPAMDGSAVRRRLGLDGKTVVGFIGTFGPWHGAEVLAASAAELARRRPELRDAVRFLFVGDGARRATAEEVLKRTGVSSMAVFTGRVPQAEGPSYLAACDILASPHVPNPDGTPFFGSPTKLFEYMAMGKPIVASRLEQIGQILAHEKSAWMVEPGDPAQVAEAVARLIDDAALRRRLGDCAREVVMSQYTWKQHTERILHALRERCR